MGGWASGALVGALLLAARRSVLGLGRNDRYLFGGLWHGLIGFGLSHYFWLSMG